MVFCLFLACFWYTSNLFGGINKSYKEDIRSIIQDADLVYSQEDRPFLVHIRVRREQKRWKAVVQHREGKLAVMVLAGTQNVPVYYTKEDLLVVPDKSGAATFQVVEQGHPYVYVGHDRNLKEVKFQLDFSRRPVGTSVINIKSILKRALNTAQTIRHKTRFGYSTYHTDEKRWDCTAPYPVQLEWVDQGFSCKDPRPSGHIRITDRNR